MEENSLASLRNALKTYISRKRLTWTQGGFLPLCAICGKPLGDGWDMNEVLLTRGDCQKSKELMAAIMVKQNVVGVHTGQCHQLAHTREGQKKCLRFIIIWETPKSIASWLGHMDMLMKGTLAREALILLIGVLNDENVSSLQQEFTRAHQAPGDDLLTESGLRSPG